MPNQDLPVKHKKMIANLSEIITVTRLDLAELKSSSGSALNKADLIEATQANLDFFLTYREELENAYASTEQ
mgnify:CR=1 FL=1